MELKYIVYITVNLCNGKFYIGVHRTNPDVFDGYIGCGISRPGDVIQKGKGIHAAVRKYGYDNFKRTTIAIFPDTEEGENAAYDLEAQIVTKTLISSKTCYNLCPGGKHSYPEESKKPVYQFDTNGKFLRVFECVREAAMHINPDNVYVTMKAIRNVCLKTSASSFGFYWSYEKKFEKIENNNITKVAQYTLSGKFLRYFDSIAEAQITLNCTSIHQAIVKKFQCAGYQWRYYTGDASDVEPLINNFTKNEIVPIKMVDKKTKEEFYYDNINDCVKANPKLQKPQIHRVLKKKIQSHKGYLFYYQQDEDMI